jgi:hypothetical protein
MEEDLDVAHYTLEELLDILGLDAKATRAEVSHAVSDRVQRSTDYPPKAYFFQEVERTILASREFAAQGQPLVRLLNIDTFYREVIQANNAGTDSFTFTLSERVTGVKALTLLSVEIPQTWYAFTAAKGTTGFVVQVLDSGLVTYTKEVVIADGNYSNASLMAAVVAGMNEALRGTALYAANLIGNGPWLALTQDPVNARATLALVSTPPFPTAIKITWFDPQYAYAALSTAKLNFNLGWALGFRYPSTALSADDGVLSAVAPSIVTAARTRYIIMKLDDHTANRLTNGMLSLGTTNQQIRLPDYSAETPIYRRGAVASAIATQPEGPRRLTAAQLFTLNSISSGVGQARLRAATSDTDVFAKIPIKHNTDWSSTDGVGSVCCVEDGPGAMMVETAGMLQKNRRTYFGPVNLTSLTVSLYDDAGNLLGLNGHDWSCTIEIESLS